MKLDIDILQRIACDSRVSTSLQTVGLKKGKLDLIAIVIGEKGKLQILQNSFKKEFKICEYLLETNVEKEVFLRKHHKIDSNTLRSILIGNSKLRIALIEKSVLTLAER